MVSAVFHNPLDASAPETSKTVIRSSERGATPSMAETPYETWATDQNNVKKTVLAKATETTLARQRPDLSFIWLGIMPPVLGLLLLVLVWEMVSLGTGASIPSPKDTFIQAVKIFSDPFYSKGPNDQGVG